MLDTRKPVRLKGQHNSLCMNQEGRILSTNKVTTVVMWNGLGFANAWPTEELENYDPKARAVDCADPCDCNMCEFVYGPHAIQRSRREAA